MLPAILLDRDGVIIENREKYVRSWADVEIYPHTLETLAAAARTPFKIVIVTNQSVVGRGIITLEMARAINDRLVAHIEAAGGRIDGVYMCPHAPDAHCPCRKPKPGMLLQAAEELMFDLTRSMIIGDALTDIAAGRAAGVEKTILLKSGRGTAQQKLIEETGVRPDLSYSTLTAALKDLL